jgi:ABC-type Fe3+ transport system permease subunit
MAKKIVKNAIKEYSASCVTCGTLVTDEAKFFSNGKNYCTSCAIISRKEEPALRVPEGVIKWICYAVSFLSPFTGFALGIVFLSQKEQASRSFGRHCMIVMCISLALILMFLIISAIMGIMGMGGDYAGPNIGEGYY